MATPLFLPYTELPQPLPPMGWRVVRWIGLAITAALVVTAIVDPSVGLKAFWSVFVPLAPALFLVAPAMWRNTCPMATLNQLPRTVGITRGLTLPQAVRDRAPLVSALLFFAVVPLRKVWLDTNGLALGVFLISVLVLAFAGGMVFKGKSGWCSQFCPMLQVERFYNLAPIALIPNSHCRPCVGCAKNCYDFNPTAANLADLADPDPLWSGQRAAFAGALPWFIAAFNTQDAVTSLTWSQVGMDYGRLLLFAAAGVGVFQVVRSLTRLSSFQLLLLHVGAAFSLFYWYVPPKALAAFSDTDPVTPRVVFALAVALVALWLVRAWPREKAFAASDIAPRPSAAMSVLKAAAGARAAGAEVTFAGASTVVADAGQPLLEVAERSGIKIEAGCRMGMCGADPVRILAGAENLSPLAGTERATLQRVGAGDGCRMACVARVMGPVSVTLDLSAAPPGEEGAAAAGEPAAPAWLDPTVRRVVVIGTGAAGTTAACELRKASESVEITVVGTEPYDFYNRMNIGKLVSEQTAIEKLYMLPGDWAEQRRVRALRGATATRIDRRERIVEIDSGERIPYDRVILASGAKASVPRLEGYGAPGTFVLRTLDHGVEMQQWIRRRRVRTAVVVGGGLLGIEAAYSMSHLGVRSYVLDRNAYPLNRQLDSVAGALLWQLIKDLGIEVVPNASARRILLGGEGEVRGVELTDGRAVEAQLCLVAAGVTPEKGLAVEAGLEAGRGVGVDDRLQTSDPHILAAGDVVEHRGRTYGLWPACVDHARIAAVNALGGDLRYYGDVPSCRLKVAGVDLLSAGERDARDGAQAITIEEIDRRRYRKLVVSNGEVRGAVMIGCPELTDAVAGAVADRLTVDAALEERLRAGEWSVLPS